MTPAAVLVLCSAPRDRADDIAEDLLQRRLVACVNLVGPVVSRFWWEGKLDRAEETLLLMKTRADLVGELQARIVAIHPYEVAEVLVFDVDSGAGRYLAWIASACKEPQA